MVLLEAVTSEDLAHFSDATRRSAMALPVYLGVGAGARAQRLTSENWWLTESHRTFAPFALLGHAHVP